MAKRAAPEINAGSMADIAFLLLIFFLVTTTMDVDTGITRKLPPPVENEDEDIDVKDRNVLKVLINSHDRLLIDGKPGLVSDLKVKAMDFMSIHPGDEEYPEFDVKMIDELGMERDMSKGIISLKNDRGTSYDMYIKVQNELASAFNQMKDDLSVELFGLKYTQLIDKKKIKGINKAIPVRISEAEPEDIGGR
ncbi:MAG: biopolymer transporter ExbD [Lentimicrobiaceae bacterium]|jgi:biopolymer transport protein ExbD|nr:biopolymer transporter ExbD [Lentimicrobiaceae bacterium]MCP4910142.1 biopolymer transporter ExbD [Bacteroidota bacterium]MBT3454805.1 biopolymer transporter ExbD [Lentimicrobiaceae bacterium]MBT3817804.1 biopolymer transporter ExbD [Lentimicrobiaceae bacterium]MBT4061167.1 biopolymer transporter ExbD [Lentimicrobiaceae bacterium]